MDDKKLKVIIEAVDKATAPLKKVAGSMDSLDGKSGKLRSSFNHLGAVLS